MGRSKRSPVGKPALKSKPPTTNIGSLLLPLLPRLPNILRTSLHLITAALALHISHLSLSPVYGSIPSSLFHTPILISLFALALTTHLLAPNLRFPSFLLALLPLYSPFLLRTLSRYSTQLGPVYGPLITESLTTHPLIFLLLHRSLKLTSPTLLTTLTTAPSFAFSLHHLLLAIPDSLAPIIGSHPLLTRCGLWHVVSALTLPTLPLRALPFLILAAPAVWHSTNVNTLCVLTPALNATLSAYNHTLIARTESNTGYIAVLDNTQLGYRVLRADHSLLGGEWHYKPRGVREPIYSIFVILEAVRLVDPPPVNTKPRALAIGLGVGTSVDALIRHGVQTDIVELDPAVYRYAGEYFGLSSNHTAYLEDAISFVKTRGPERQGTYDFVLHDVFTGGAVPAGLFTREFFRGLERMMKDDGVVAVNWAGDLGGDRKEVRAILETIREVFGSGCRSFREDEEKEKKEGDKEDFTNMVTFCLTPRHPIFRTNPSHKISFRQPTPEDLLSSYARELFLYPKHEVFFSGDDSEEKVILTEVNVGKTLRKWQEKSAVGHWALIRTVVEGGVWEEY